MLQARGNPWGSYAPGLGGDAWNGSPGGDLLLPKNCPVVPAGSGQRRNHLCAFDTELLGLCQNCLLDPTQPHCPSPSWVSEHAGPGITLSVVQPVVLVTWLQIPLVWVLNDNTQQI